MSYKAAIPQANDQISISQGDLLGNFTEINTYLTVDHEAFNGATQGKHKAVHLINQSLAPTAPVTGAGECAIYSAPGVGAVPALFFKGQNSATTVDGIDFTSHVANATGWTRLPSGILLQWGPWATTLPTGSVTKQPTIVYTALYNVQVTTSDVLAGTANNFANVTNFVIGVGVSTFNVETFTRSGAKSAASGMWFSIGV